jgi:hypothetical protein
MSGQPFYKMISYWMQSYGSVGVADQKAVETFVECETAESVKILQSELQSVLRGNYTVDGMDKLVKAKRRILHNSYEEWAKLMLLWIVSYKNR